MLYTDFLTSKAVTVGDLVQFTDLDPTLQQVKQWIAQGWLHSLGKYQQRYRPYFRIDDHGGFDFLGTLNCHTYCCNQSCLKCFTRESLWDGSYEKDSQIVVLVSKRGCRN